MLADAFRPGEIGEALPQNDRLVALSQGAQRAEDRGGEAQLRAQPWSGRVRITYDASAERA